MSQLTKFRDHCRKMANADHRFDCTGQYRTAPKWALSEDGYGLRLLAFPKPPTCNGCLPDADRERFRQLADEADRYLGGAS